MRLTAELDTEPTFSAAIDAAQTGPVYVARNDRNVAVVLSPAHYERLRQTAIEELDRFCDEMSDKAEANGMTEEILQKLLEDE